MWEFPCSATPQSYWLVMIQADVADEYNMLTQNRKGAVKPDRQERRPGAYVGVEF